VYISLEFKVQSIYENDEVKVDYRQTTKADKSVIILLSIDSRIQLKLYEKAELENNSEEFI
jgi:hypothetical protein